MWNSTGTSTSYIRIEWSYYLKLVFMCSFGYLLLYTVGIRVWFILSDVDVVGLLLVLIDFQEQMEMICFVFKI